MMKNSEIRHLPVKTQGILGSFLTIGGLILGGRTVSNQIKGAIDYASEQIKSILKQIEEKDNFKHEQLMLIPELIVRDSTGQSREL